MHTAGYIKLPRTINTLPLGARALLIYICTEAQYRQAEHPIAGMLNIGELVTSRSIMMTQTGLSSQQVREALAHLERREFIAVEATARYSKITLTWRDFITLNGYDIMLNNQANNQANNQVDTSATCEDLSSCEDGKITTTKQTTKQTTNNLIKYIRNNNTHTSNSLGRILNAPARDAHTRDACASPEAVELIDWMARFTPDLTTMKYPLTMAQAQRIVTNYTMEDIRRIMSVAWSKGAHLVHSSAYTTFRSYADNDRVLRDRARDEATTSRLYTYEEMCDIVTRRGGRQDILFRPIPQPHGKPLWQKIC